MNIIEKNNKPFINFKRERDLGECISDAFSFIRYEYKSIFQVFLRVLGPVFLLMVAAVVYYTYATGNSFNSIFSNMNQPNPDLIRDGFGNMFISFFVFLLATWLYYSMLYGAVQFTVKSYIENEGTIIIEEVADGVRRNWLRFLGINFITFIISFIGFMLCVIPGIYVIVPLSLLFSIVIFDNINVMDSVSYSFKLIKDNWWNSFFTLFVAGVVYYLVSLIFQIPAIIYYFVQLMTMQKDISTADPSSFFDWVYLSLNAIASIGGMIVYFIIPLIMTFVYFNLNEKKNQTGTYENIENIGKQD